MNDERPRDVSIGPAIDVAMPTYHSEPVIELSLGALERSVSNSPITINQLVIVDNHSADGTVSIAERRAEEFGWESTIIEKSTSLPEARAVAIDTVETEWFLFLDDDVVVSESYLPDLLAGVSPLTGGVQGRKTTETRQPSTWVHYRSTRGGTHATLLRHDAVSDIQIPADLEVLEDEYIRQHVENERSLLWVFNHQAVFHHENQMRHSIGWKEGYLGGKYGLTPGYRLLIDAAASVLDGQNPVPHCTRTAGFVVGTVRGRIFQ